MLSFLSSYNQARWKSKTLKAQAKIMQANAQGARNRANAQAFAIEDTARKNQQIAAQNLMSARDNQRHQVAAVKAARAHSGVSSEGTGTVAEEDAQATLDKYISNMALSASISMTNSIQSAIDTRRQGEIEAVAQEDMANIYSAQAANIRNAANQSLAAGIIGFSYGSLNSLYEQGGDTFSGMLSSATNLESLETAILKGSDVGGSAYHASAAFSPYISALSADANSRKNNWGSLLSVISGNIPYKTPAASQIFSDYI